MVGTFDAFHAFIGEKIYNDRAGKSLAKRGILFYESFYTTPRTPTGYGTLQPYHMPSLSSPEWLVPSSQTRECFAQKLYQEVQRCLRVNVANRMVKITFFMPLHVFLDLFYGEEIRQTFSMFICKPETFLDFLELNWDVKQL